MGFQQGLTQHVHMVRGLELVQQRTPVPDFIGLRDRPQVDVELQQGRLEVGDDPFGKFCVDRQGGFRLDLLCEPQGGQHDHRKMGDVGDPLSFAASVDAKIG